MKYSEIKFRSSISFSEELLIKVSKESSLSKEEVNLLSLEVKKEYKEVLLPKLKDKISKELGELKANTKKALDEIEKTRVESINNIKENIDSTTKEYDDSIKGAEIVAKRARIKENNNYDILERDIKLQELDLYNDYSNLLKVVSGKKRAFIDSIQTMYSDINNGRICEITSFWFSIS